MKKSASASAVLCACAAMALAPLASAQEYQALIWNSSTGMTSYPEAFISSGFTGHSQEMAGEASASDQGRMGGERKLDDKVGTRTGSLAFDLLFK